MKYIMPETGAEIIQSLETANHLIKLSYQNKKPDAAALYDLASAHYTLALLADLPIQKILMHMNNAVVTLKSLPKSLKMGNCLANAYFKRAEIFEASGQTQCAADDYFRAIELWQQQVKTKRETKLLLAQANTSLADILLHDLPSLPLKFMPAIVYLEQAFAELKSINKVNDEFWLTKAYAFQILGTYLQIDHFDLAIASFQNSIFLGCQAEAEEAYAVLEENYNCLAIAFENQFRQGALQPGPQIHLIDSMTFYAMALLFVPNGKDYYEQEDHLSFVQLIDMIQRIINPYLPSIINYTLERLIDALIYAHYGISENILPNQIISQDLSGTAARVKYAYHIELLLEEANRRYHLKDIKILSLDPQEFCMSQTMQQFFKQGPCNIIQFPKLVKGT